jgi:hypothetical protein
MGGGEREQAASLLELVICRYKTFNYFLTTDLVPCGG